VPENARKYHWYSTGGPWGTGLAILGVAVTVQGVSYIDTPQDDLRSALAWVNDFVPIAGWGLLWVAAGVWSLWKAFTPPQRHSDITPPVAVISLWSGLYAGYWLYMLLADGQLTRDWVSAVAWGSLAAVLIFFGRCNNPPRRLR
jgi:RsiW-degrading membrane proteinase PrsW (M82 family)